MSDTHTNNNETLTKRQIASRENGKLGGPKTQEGLNRSRFNAYKHGLYARRAPVLTTEDRTSYDSLADSMHSHHAPQGPQEIDIVDQLIDNMWRYHRYAGCQEWFIESQMSGQYEWIKREAPEGIPLDARHALAIRGLLSRQNTPMRELSRLIDRLQRAQFRLLAALKNLQGPRFNSGAAARQKDTQKPANEPTSAIESTPPITEPAAWAPVIAAFSTPAIENPRKAAAETAPLRYMVA